MTNNSPLIYLLFMGAHQDKDTICDIHPGPLLSNLRKLHRAVDIGTTTHRAAGDLWLLEAQ